MADRIPAEIRRALRPGEHAEPMDAADVPSQATGGWQAIRKGGDGHEYIEAELFRVPGRGVVRLDDWINDDDE